MTPDPRPAPDENDADSELHQELLLVKELLGLPINENSSALQTMDAWEIARFIRAYTAREVEKALDNAIEFMDYLTTGTLEEQRAKLKAAQEWNDKRKAELEQSHA